MKVIFIIHCGYWIDDIHHAYEDTEYRKTIDDCFEIDIEYGETISGIIKTKYGISSERIWSKLVLINSNKIYDGIAADAIMGKEIVDVNATRISIIQHKGMYGA